MEVHFQNDFQLKKKAKEAFEWVIEKKKKSIIIVVLVWAIGEKIMKVTYK